MGLCHRSIVVSYSRCLIALLQATSDLHTSRQQNTVSCVKRSRSSRIWSPQQCIGQLCHMRHQAAAVK